MYATKTETFKYFVGTHSARCTKLELLIYKFTRFYFDTAIIHIVIGYYTFYFSTFI
ncbi:putative membrane protein [Proteiniphilum saccharofermentans]|uniref:Putative membrane protein n=1 Tax=Proteiniphilum saccharofermentans TaxID=1642647 RepID=A0A1R3SUX0_9BACT|nr:putative membrane protein [Proteiniphilum saccharofermentans]SDZ87278.1 hypothetical protein SAMN05216331_10819 [Porphyromonadaceae bacterium KH3R12]